jgi:predicted CopG family antitoxin
MQTRADDMTKRMTISVDDDVYETLETWASEEVRTVANLAAALVTIAARDKQQKKSPATESKGT